jgi:allophanate hydrolase
VIEILRAPPFATVQDEGRPGLRNQGVPPSGAMDREALALVNLLVGNAPGTAALEWALGGGTLRLEEQRLIAAAGGPVSVNGTDLPPWTAFPAGPDDSIALGLPAGRFGLLAIGGGVAIEPVLGSRSTYLRGGFGGIEGRRLRGSDRLPLGPAPRRTEPRMLPEEFWPEARSSIRVVPGPQEDFFGEDAWEALLGDRYVLDAASDRMGCRLAGPALSHRGAATLPSEPVCPGAVQVPGGGAPIVLMPDGPTVGGYPKLAVVITADLGRLAQHPPGARPSFTLATFDEAVAALRDRAARLRTAALVLSTVSP